MCINNKRPFETHTSFVIWWACLSSANCHDKSVLKQVDVTMILVLFRNDLRYLIYHLGNNKVCGEYRNRAFRDQKLQIYINIHRNRSVKIN